MQNHHVTCLEIDLNAITHNYQYLKSKTHANTMVLAVVKAFAYGLDDVMIAKHLQKLDVDYFGVAYADEGIRLRKNGITKPVLVLHAQPENYHLCLTHNLEPNIYSLHHLQKCIDFTYYNQLKEFPIHLKFNSGLNRLGINTDEVKTTIDLLKSNSAIKTKSILSHIAASEDLNQKAFTEKQIDTFKQIVSQIHTSISDDIIVHMSNTSGAINYKNAHFNMIRLGIGLYGFGNDDKETLKLKNVATLKSKISQIRTINKGESVSYNMAFTADKTEKIAIIPIGHADGFSRPLGCGKGYVTINNQKAYTVGNICMDMILVNITDIDCKTGDEVIIFNNQQTIEEFATICNTISYEVLTAISQRIKRLDIC